MQYFRIHGPAGKILACVAGALTAGTLLAGPAAARTKAAPVLLYNYEFAGTKGTVSNSAPGGPAVTLTLHGNWSAVKNGVQFSGNTTNRESVAAGRPTSGYTLNEPASAAIGFGALIVYNKPATGTCFANTPNVTQIGYEAGHTGQAKIQLSSCATSKTQTMVECRFSGANTTIYSTPLVSTLALVNDAAYNISCVKSPDAGGHTTITLNVTPVSTGKTVTTTTTKAAMGAVQTKQFISVGNKFPLPKTFAKNIDQFNGIMTRTVYCAGSSSAVASCLSTNLPG